MKFNGEANASSATHGISTLTLAVNPVDLDDAQSQSERTTTSETTSSKAKSHERRFRYLLSTEISHQEFTL